MTRLEPTAAAAPHSPDRDEVVLALDALDTLWLQVGGTLCNLACRHCFISCGPRNDSHAFMDVAAAAAALRDAEARGVKDIYFTGGEPFLHPQIRELIDLALAVGPLTILTNGMLIDAAMAAWLRERFDASRYSLELRVSLDGTSARSNDPVRGRGTFTAIVEALQRLAAVGLSPVVTVTEVDGVDAGSRERFAQLLRDAGLRQPRLKFLAPFRIGREARRGRPYDPSERLTHEAVDAQGLAALQCASSRMVTARGVWPCPILIDDDGARLGDALGDGLRPIALRSPACHTCYVEGVTCRT
ncbi:MAG: radical SAM protein [Myxococcales bacterium]|nr:radical SAM protein [Myxococcales bacterium]MCB9532315.1 radical SAM protein [Myxococcales bacterium]